MTLLYTTYSSPSGIAAPTRPIRIPSIRNGALTNRFVAPISYMIPISSFRTEIPIVTVLLIRKTDTARRIRMIAMET